ncbi:MAG TPA: Gfo/Idh/MocA family oxidoreductase, partial [Gemmatimonadales bacterium]|nr:Gfo/Idh/MocA family oxidoreductase [Gemmatimonadales bacterium]
MRSSPDPKVYRGALVGLGGIARLGHLPAFRADPQVASRLQIVGIVDDAPNASRSFDGIPLLSQPDKLSDLGPLDFVDICTPTSSHLDLSLWGLSQGYHVLCEKPVAVNRAEAARLAAAALDAGRVVMPCHQYRFNPVWLRVKRWLDEGVIGRWYLAEFRVYRLAADPGAGQAPVPWRGRRADGRGGVVLDHGTHLVYELLDVAGPPQSVQAWTGRLRHGGYDVEDTAQILFTYPDRMATMFLTWAARRRETEIRFIGERGSIT